MAEEEKREVEKVKETEQKEPVAKEEPAVKKEEAVSKKEEEPAEKPPQAEDEKAKVKASQTPQPVSGPVKPTNCVQCNKPLKRGMRYYRNGKFYCNKRCWKKSTEKVA